jgi:hypothetical protein
MSVVLDGVRRSYLAITFGQESRDHHILQVCKASTSCQPRTVSDWQRRIAWPPTDPFWLHSYSHMEIGDYFNIISGHCGCILCCRSMYRLPVVKTLLSAKPRGTFALERVARQAEEALKYIWQGCHWG